MSIPISEVAHLPEIKEMLAKLKSGEISMCACLGPMWNEPFCPCFMKSQNLPRSAEYEAANTPEAIAEVNKQLSDALSEYK